MVTMSHKRLRWLVGGDDNSTDSAILKALIDSRNYNQVVSFIEDNNGDINIADTNYLRYIIEQGHFPLYVTIVSQGTRLLPDRSVDRKDIENTLINVQNLDNINNWIKPLLENKDAFYAINSGNLLSFIMKYRFDPTVFQVIPKYLNWGLAKLHEALIDVSSSDNAVEKLKQGIPYMSKQLLDQMKSLQRNADANPNVINMITSALPSEDELFVTWFMNLNSIDTMSWSRVSMKFPKISKDLYVATLARKIEQLVLRDNVDLSEFIQSFDSFQEYVTSELWDKIVTVIVKFYLNRFNFKSLIALYLGSDPSLVTFDHLMKEAIDKGFAISGSTNFPKFIDNLRSEVSHAVRYDSELRKHRAEGFVSYILDIYSDIPEIIAYTEDLSPRSIDSLYMYAYSSAVVNEPFKSTAFTASQKKLEAERRRPTDVQHEYITIMDDILRNAPKTTKPLYAWRGVGVPSFDVVNLHLDIFKSLSLSPDVSLSYLRGEPCCLMRVHIPPGTPLMSMDPVQKFKNQGGLFEYVLPRGAIFKLVDTIQIGKHTVYDCTIEFDMQYEQQLAPGRLRKQKDKMIRNRYNPMARKVLTEKPKYTTKDIDDLAQTIADKISNFRAMIHDQESLDAFIAKFKSIFVEIGNGWRIKALARDKYVDEESFIQLMKKVCIKVADSLNPQVQFLKTYIENIYNYNVNMDEFYTYSLNRKS